MAVASTFLVLLAWYVSPIIRGHVSPIAPPNTAELTYDPPINGYLWPGYGFPSVLLALLAGALLPAVLPTTRLPDHVKHTFGVIASLASLLLALLAMLCLYWVALTPLYQ